MAANEGRPPPAYQEYAASMLASHHFRVMALAQRGLLNTMRLECWVNKTLPAEPSVLARFLGLDADEVRAALPAVMPFFAVEDGEIQCPELDSYRALLETRRLAQSEAGKRTAAALNAKTKVQRGPKSGAKQGALGDTAKLPANHPATPLASVQLLSTAQSKPNQANPPLEKELAPVDPWVAEYTATELAECTADAYRKASRG